ncbi:matrix-remodeling-associated protein 7 isoform X2 [Trichosurus vulpecula]|uniref:matrix-remodeling-associated protein 7 isoform X2 n=1 Tax=Trichosurus vulpecula TaxID=9337 RepID=UPI00186B0243|nr:matrix-remodeling-associated protein 7 isoform X2 [Trichosurus vulpecula]
MEALAEVLAALPFWGSALALLLASLWLWRGQDRALPSPEVPAPPKQAGPSGGGLEVRTRGPARYELEEPRTGAGREEQEQKEEEEEEEEEERQDEEPNSDSKTMPLLAELEEDEEEVFSFKYSPGKLRGNQYKKMMTKEELEEEQRIELTSDFTCL